MAKKLSIEMQPKNYKPSEEPEPTAEQLERSSIFWRTGLCRCAGCGNVIRPDGLTHNRAEYGYWVDIILTTDGEPVCAVHEQCALDVIVYGVKYPGPVQEFQQLYYQNKNRS